MIQDFLGVFIIRGKDQLIKGSLIQFKVHSLIRKYWAHRADLLIHLLQEHDSLPGEPGQPEHFEQPGPRVGCWSCGLVADIG